MNTKFGKNLSYIKRLRENLFFARCEFRIWKTLDSIRYDYKNPKSQKIIGDFRDFFLITIESHRTAFLLELVKFFDVDKDALTLGKLITSMEGDRSSLTRKEYKEHNSDWPNIEKYAEEYIGIQMEDLNKCRKLLLKNGWDISKKGGVKEGSLLGRLKGYRDQKLVHTQKNEGNAHEFSTSEIEELFKLAEKILEILLGKLQTEFFYEDYDHYEHYTRVVVDHLVRFEPYRLQEIKEERDAMINQKIDH